MPDRPLRIACAIGQLDRRGSEQELYNFLNHLDRDRFTPEVWVMYDNGNWESAFHDLGVEVTAFSQWPKVQRPYRLWQRARQRRIDLWWSWNYYLGQYAYCLPPGTPAISILHEALAAARAQAGWRYRLCEVGPRLLITNHPEGVQGLRRAGHRGEVAWVGNPYVPVTLSPEEKTKWRACLGAASGATLVAGAGQLTGSKNYGLLLEAFSQLPQTNLRLALVGDGPERAALEARAAQPDLAGKVVFTGRLPGAARAIAAADLFVHPSQSEGMPNVVIEALGAGVPAVATRVHGLAHLIRSEGEGWIVPQNDPAALRAALCAALADLPEARRKAARAGARLRVLHSAQRVTGLLEAWALYVLRLGPRPRPFDEMPN